MIPRLEAEALDCVVTLMLRFVRAPLAADMVLPAYMTSLEILCKCLPVLERAHTKSRVFGAGLALLRTVIQSEHARYCEAQSATTVRSLISGPASHAMGRETVTVATVRPDSPSTSEQVKEYARTAAFLATVLPLIWTQAPDMRLVTRTVGSAMEDVGSVVDPSLTNTAPVRDPLCVCRSV